jgi:hypothetical protein
MLHFIIHPSAFRLSPVVTVLQRVMDIIDPPSLPAGPDKPKIGFKP